MLREFAILMEQSTPVIRLSGFACGNAVIYAGLPNRHLWLTAVMAARFLASAFAAGPALLIILYMVLRKTTKFDAGEEPAKRLSIIVTYAMILNLFFLEDVWHFAGAIAHIML